MTPERRYNEEELLALSGIQHFFFCPRQWALIHIERQWEENALTVEGHYLHKRVDNPFFSESRDEKIITRSVPLISYRLGLYGVADVLEFIRSAEGVHLPGYEGRYQIKPVEYKRGKPKVDRRDEVQLCAQAMCLEEVFDTPILTGDFYYQEIRRRVRCDLNEDLRGLVTGLSREMHDLFVKGLTPRAEKDQKCKNCSLVDICMPDLTRKPLNVKKYIRFHVNGVND